MPKTKDQFCLSIDMHLKWKLFLLSHAKRDKLGEKNATMSGIVEKALTEYFENHQQEVDEAMAVYKELGVRV